MKHKVSLIILCFFTLVMLGCEREEEAPNDTAPPIQQLTTFSMHHREEGILKWTLVGAASEMRGDKVSVQNPKVQIFEDGNVSITLTGNIGHYYSSGENKNNLFLYEDVVGVNENGTLYTKELHWRNNDGTLYSPTEVKIVRGDSTWYGTEMVANPNLETVKMTENRFTIYPNDEENKE